MWAEFAIGSLPCSERFFLGYPGFPLFSKTNTSKFQFDLESMDVTRLNLFIRTPKCFVGKQIIVKRSKYFPLNDCDHFIYSTFFVSMYWYCLEKFDVVHPWDLKGEPFLFVRLKYFIKARYAIYKWPKLKVDWFCVIRSKLKISCWMLRKRWVNKLSASVTLLSSPSQLFLSCHTTLLLGESIAWQDKNCCLGH